MNGTVHGLTVFDDKLIAVGQFSTAGGKSINRIDAWDGSSWKSLGSQVDGTILAVTTYGNKVIIGGNFTTVGAAAARGIAAWTPQ